MRFPRVKILITFIISSLLLISCSKNDEIIDLGDGGLSSGDPCSAPCFQNITPGITTKDQAIEILQFDLNPKKCDYWDNLSIGGSRGMLCKNVYLGLTEKDIISSISYTPVKKVFLEDVIEKYGVPDCYYESGSGVENTAPYLIRLYFDNVYMVVYLPEQSGPIYLVQEETQIERYLFFEKAEYLTYKGHCEEWGGYGEY